MGTNCAPLLADLFLYSYEVEFIQNLLHDKNKYLWFSEVDIKAMLDFLVDNIFVVFGDQVF